MLVGADHVVHDHDGHRDDEYPYPSDPGRHAGTVQLRTARASGDYGTPLPTLSHAPQGYMNTRPDAVAAEGGRPS